MINKYKLIKKIICFSVFLVAASSLFGQSRSKVAIFPVINDSKLSYIDALATTAEDNILFMISQLENYNLVDERDADLPSFEISDLRNAAKGKNCDYIIYGSISGQSPFTLSLFLFERGSNKIIGTRVGIIKRMTEVFNVSDKLALALLEDLTGEKIRRGELRVINNGAPGSFVVSINNRKLDVGVSSIHLMQGKYRIKIEGINDKTKKRKTLYSEKIIIEERGQTPVEFTLPVWGKGTLSFKNAGTNTGANYTVNIDGEGQEANISKHLLATGRHKIEIFDTDNKNKKIYSKTITVKEGKETNIPFKINAPELGTITFINQGKAGSFDVTLDGQNLGQNLSKTTAEKGSHTIDIYELINEKRTKVLSKKITVKNKGTSPIKFKLRGTLIKEGSDKEYNIGDTGPAGGLIFYDKGSYTVGWRYLEAAPASTEWKSKVWGGYETTVTGADGTAVGTGKQNTIDIVTQFGASEPYANRKDYAAKLCSDLKSGGYDDWFLPSKDELNKIFKNPKLKYDGGFALEYYWSSSEDDSDNAWDQNFFIGNQYYYSKLNNKRVRAVRAF